MINKITHAISGRIKSDEHLAWLKQPRGQVYSGYSYKRELYRIDRGFIKGRSRSFHLVESHSFTTAEDMQEQEKARVADVLQIPSWLGSESRLIDFGKNTDQLPEIDYDNKDLLIIEQLHVPDNQKKPHIVGLKLVGQTIQGGKVQFAFEQAPEDPYQQDDLPIPDISIERLANSYRAVGLTELAEALDDKTGVTIDQLVDLIKSRSDYFISDTDHEPGMVAANHKEFENLSISQKEGRLQAQCDGANLLLKQSIRVLYSRDMAVVKAGYVFDPSRKKISGAKHAQTVFVDHGGVTRVLDATPASSHTGSRRLSSLLGSSALMSGDAGSVVSFENLPRRSKSRSLRVASRVSKKRREQKKLELEPEPEHSDNSREVNSVETLLVPLRQEVVDVMRQRRETSSNVWSTLRNGLSNILNAPNDDELYKSLNALPEADPIRRVAKLVMVAPSRLDDPDFVTQTEALIEYLDTYSRATTELRSRAGVKSYDNTLINSLTDTVRQIHALQKHSR